MQIGTGLAGSCCGAALFKDFVNNWSGLSRGSPTHANWYRTCFVVSGALPPSRLPGPAWEPAGAAGLDAVKVSWLRFEFAWIAVGVVIAVVVGAAWAVAVSVVSFSGSCLGCCCCGC